MRSSRSTVLETAILGQLASTPLHGYQLRKLLAMQLGPFRAFSYGTLYPALKTLQNRGLITSTEVTPAATRATSMATTARAATGKRSRIVYELTDAGRDHLRNELAQAGPAAWEDDNFDIRFALFGQTDADTRLRILEGRRTRLTERMEAARTNWVSAGQLGEYPLELQRHGLEQVEHEVSWLDKLITTERERAIRVPSHEMKERG
ncbi:MAG: PadR family transcriptional regulator [Cellulomonadaceae bacterium]|nr:PadR family transcriptional regulator [Cellulomonadaceae bacterium]